MSQLGFGCLIVLAAIIYSLTLLSAEAVSCQFPQRFPHGTVTYENSEDVGESAAGNNYILRFRCKHGYQLTGSEIITCIQGECSSTFPECVRLYCASPPYVANGIYKIIKGVNRIPVIGSGVTYSCSNGFELEDENAASLTCVLNDTSAVWFGQMPRCKETDRCADPGTSSDGRREGNCCFKGDTLKFFCNEGFEIIGQQEIECLANGSWSAPRARCRATGTFCPDPPDIIHGKMIPDRAWDFFVPDTRVMISCDDGYAIKDGVDQLHCTSDGSWDDIFGRCEAAGCQFPKSFPHGTVTYENPATVRKGVAEDNYILQFHCNSGYQLAGPEIITCAQGVCSSRFPKCVMVPCEFPMIPLNGSVPELKAESAKTFPDGFTLTYVCDDGLRLVGSSMNSCKKGKWTSETPKCEGPYDFNNKERVSNGLKTKGVLDVNFPGQIVLYFVIDSSGSIGERNFQTGIEFAKALVRKVGISEHVRAGCLTYSTETVLQFLPVELQTTEEAIGALDEINYTPGGADLNGALEKLVTNDLPTMKEYLGPNTKSSIFIITDGKVNMDDDTELIAQQLKDAGVDIVCIGTTSRVRKSSLYGLASDPKEEYIFILNNYNRMSWLIQEIINGTIDYSECGVGLETLPTRYEERLLNKKEENKGEKGSRAKTFGGLEAAEPWPWMAALFFTTDPWDGLHRAKLQCGGSIVGNQWILTTAHCLFFKDMAKNNVLRDPRKMIIKLGLTDLKNQTSLLEFQPTELVTHEEFNPVTLDYDVALIKLDRLIDYSAYVRPICLPPDDIPPESTLYKSGENAFVTGWGHDKPVFLGKSVKLNTVEHLKELRVPIQSNEKCQKSLEGTTFVFTDRMFCAGSGLGEVESCKGDGGSPVMQSQLNADGNVYWVQVGIVSWGIGCGQPHTYDFYTHLHQVKNWVVEKMKVN